MERENTITAFDDDDDDDAHCKTNRHHNEKMDKGGPPQQLSTKEMAWETTKTVGETTDNEDDDEEEAGSYFDDVGFLFEEGDQPTRVEHFEWHGVGTPSSSSPTKKEQPLPERSINVQLRIVDGEKPETVMSGHYLWPAAKKLADYIVQHHHSTIQPASVVELGAGCALLSCVALQLWQPSLECIVVTDRDPGTLERARDNYESTIQALLDRSVSEDDLNAAINETASIHFAFLNVPWGDEVAIRKVRSLLGEHQTRKKRQQRRADVLLASDVLYDAAVVEPLLQTAKDLMTEDGVLWLAQSHHNNETIQGSIAAACTKLGMQWTTLVDQKGEVPIQAFRLAGEVENSNNSFDEEHIEVRSTISTEDKATNGEGGVTDSGSDKTE
mmetsp:Transcript_17481/g.35186  ORF Transcript_17481/g.35186 Transcript_17481/m.35186 type:complete len:385 (-) Transcript_17481:90-1244(-)|eukprot:scaffold8306_cov171-Amphora_coffeaeformis.AAC.9